MVKVFFEKITYFDLPVIVLCLLRKQQIFVFDFEFNMKKIGFLRWLINTQRITRVYIDNLAEAHGKAIDLTEEMFLKMKEHSAVPFLLSELYGNSDTDQLFKKGLVSQVFKCLFINDYLCEEEKELNKDGQLYFVPFEYGYFSKQINVNSQYHLRTFKNIKIKVFPRNLLAVVKRFFDKTAYLAGAFFYVAANLLFIKMGKAKNKKEPQKRSFKYAIAIDQLSPEMSLGQRGVDFLLDEKNISKQNTIFIINHQVNSQWLKDFIKNGYNVLDVKAISSLKHIMNTSYRASFLKRTVVFMGDLLKKHQGSISFLRTVCISLKVFVEWNIVLREVSFDNYIYTNQDGARQIAINLLLARADVKTWNYACFLGGGYVSCKSRDLKEARNVLWAFQCFDHYVGMNEDVVGYYKLHYQKGHKYHCVGSIYSQGILEKAEEALKKDFVLEHFKEVDIQKAKIVSFFDTSFVDSEECLTNYTDCLNFYQDILKLLNDIKEVLVVIKTSKNAKWFVDPSFQWSSPDKGKEIIAIWDTLRNDKRVFWVPDSSYAGGGVNFAYNNTVIAVSDIVVTHCMSSPTAEALGAGKKAFWYESMQKHADTIYDNIPGLVVHGYRSLKEQIEKLLYETTDMRYKEWLNNYIEGKVVSDLSGSGLTRFRELLTKK